MDGRLEVEKKEREAESKRRGAETGELKNGEQLEAAHKAGATVHGNGCWQADTYSDAETEDGSLPTAGTLGSRNTLATKLMMRRGARMSRVRMGGRGERVPPARDER